MTNTGVLPKGLTDIIKANIEVINSLEERTEQYKLTAEYYQYINDWLIDVLDEIGALVNTGYKGKAIGTTTQKNAVIRLDNRLKPFPTTTTISRQNAGYYNTIATTNGK